MITGKLSDHVLLSAGILFFLAAYTMLRHIFTGLEHPNVGSKSAYKMKRREVLMGSITAFAIYLIVSIGHKLIFKPDKSWLDVFGPAILFLIFYVIFSYISVRRSYKKNKEIFNDEK